MHKCPLHGNPCDNPKIIHVTEVGANYMVEKTYDLCQICGNNKINEALIPKTKISSMVQDIIDLLSVTVASGKIITEIPQLSVKSPCPFCETTIYDIIKSSRLGCAKCYEHYKEELIPVILKAHKSMDHKGKQPKYKTSLLSLEEQIYVLKLKIKQAIEQEQYEKAKELKDQLDIIFSKDLPNESSSD